MTIFNLVNIIGGSSIVIISLFIAIKINIGNKDLVTVALKSIESDFKKIERMINTKHAEKRILRSMYNESVSLLKKIYDSPIPDYKPTVAQYKKCEQLNKWALVLSDDIEHFSFVS